MKLWDLSGYSEKSNFQEIQFLKQGPAYKREGPDPHKGSDQQWVKKY